MLVTIRALRVKVLKLTLCLKNQEFLQLVIISFILMTSSCNLRVMCKKYEILFNS